MTLFPFCTIVITCTNPEPILFIKDPQNNSEFAIVPPSITTDVAVSYDIVNFHQSIDICVRVEDFTRCVRAPSKSDTVKLNNLSEGNHILMFYLRQSVSPFVEYKTVHRLSFSLFQMEKFLPRLDFTNFSHVTQESIEDGINLPFLIDWGSTNTSMLSQMLEVCVQRVYENENGSRSVFVACTSIQKRQIRLVGVAPGYSNCSLFFRRNTFPYYAFKNSISKEILVTNVQIYIIPKAKKMISFIYSKDETAEFDISFDFVMSEESPRNSENFQTCINISTLFLSWCVKSNNNNVHIENVPIGEYVVELFLQSINSAIIRSSSIEVDISVRLKSFVEFIPSYDWQSLEPWHTIPVGLITRSISSIFSSLY